MLIGIIFTSPNKPLIRDASLLSEYNSYIIRSFFLAVLFLGYGLHRLLDSLVLLLGLFSSWKG